MASTTHHSTQTHADVTRDVLGTLSQPGKGYYILLASVSTALATPTTRPRGFSRTSRHPRPSLAGFHTRR